MSHRPCWLRCGKTLDQTFRDGDSSKPGPRNCVPKTDKNPGARVAPRPGLVTGRMNRHVLLISPASPRRSSPNRLFYLDRRPGLLELLLDLGGLVLVDAFLDRLGRAFNQILGLLEAESGDRPHLFDDVDLLFA